MEKDSYLKLLEAIKDTEKKEDKYSPSEYNFSLKDFDNEGKIKKPN